MTKVAGTAYRIVVTLFFGFILLGCAMTEHTMDKPISKIVYSFKDASVPPEYHRSYTISITEAQAHITVDSYGDILVEKTVDMPKQTMDDLAKYIQIYQIKEKDRNNETMTWPGGTSKALKVYSVDDMLLDGIVYQSDSRVEGNLSGDIDAFAEKLVGLITDFPKLLE